MTPSGIAAPPETARHAEHAEHDPGGAASRDRFGGAPPQALMGEITKFPGAHRSNGRRVVVAIDDALFAMLPASELQSDGLAVIYVPASSLADPNTDADLWLGKYAPSAPGRVLFFQTASGATYEIDEQLRVWRSGEPVYTEPLADFGTPDTGERGVLRTGQRAALLFLTRLGDGWHARIRLTTPVVLCSRPPEVGGRRPVPSGWLALARRSGHEPRDDGA